MPRWVCWMVLIALVTGSTETFAQAPPVQRAPPVVPEIPQDTWRQGPPPDTRAVSRRFVRAVHGFDTAVRRLDSGTTAPSDRDLAYAIERFARALESAPNAEYTDMSSAVADMRIALSEAQWAGPPGSPQVWQTLADALFIGADGLLELAYGPYQRSPDVTWSAWELEKTIDSIRGNDSSNDRRRLMLALQQSANTMNAMVQMPRTPPPPPPRRYQNW